MLFWFSIFLETFTLLTVLLNLLEVNYQIFTWKLWGRSFFNFRLYFQLHISRSWWAHRLKIDSQLFCVFLTLRIINFLNFSGFNLFVNAVFICAMWEKQLQVKIFMQDLAWCWRGIVWRGRRIAWRTTLILFTKIYHFVPTNQNF